MTMKSLTLVTWIGITLIWILGTTVAPSAALKCYDCDRLPGVDCVNLPKGKLNELSWDCNISYLDRVPPGRVDHNASTDSPTNVSTGATSPPSTQTSAPTTAGPAVGVQSNTTVITTLSATNGTATTASNATTVPPNNQTGGTGDSGGTTFESAWNTGKNGTLELSDKFVWVCVKEDVYVAAKLPPGVKSSKKEEQWEYGSSADYGKPTFVSRYCGLVSKSYDLKKHPNTIDERGGKFALRVSYCTEDNCNFAVKHGQSLGIIVVTIVVTLLTSASL